MRLPRRLGIVALFYFALAAGAAGAAWRWQDNRDNDNGKKGDKGQVFRKEIYRLVSMASGKASDDTDLDIKVYRSSDGTGVTTVHGRFSSPEKANAELQHEIKQATRVIEKGTKGGRFGGVVGQRAVLVVTGDVSREEATQVVWTNGSHLYKIKSISPSLALDMEKRHY